MLIAFVMKVFTLLHQDLAQDALNIPIGMEKSAQKATMHAKVAIDGINYSSSVS